MNLAKLEAPSEPPGQQESLQPAGAVASAAWPGWRLYWHPQPGRDGHGMDWLVFHSPQAGSLALPRRHLVGFELDGPGKLRFLFTTHTVIVAAKNARGLLEQILAGQVSELAEGLSPDTVPPCPPNVRPVDKWFYKTLNEYETAPPQSLLRK